VIALTGATGHVGRLVAEELAKRGEPMRLLVRDPARAPKLPGAEAVHADYGEPASIAAALGEGDRVFMVSLHEGPERRVPLHRSFIEAAAAKGVGLVVYLSFVNAGPDALFLHARSHGATEAMLAGSGVPFTAIRNGMYADEVAGWFDPDGVAREPVAEGRIAFSYRLELAEAIAVVLTQPGHAGKVYDIVGEPVGLGELARIASDATGAAYRYEPAPVEDWVARWRARGAEDWSVEAGVTSFEAQAAGEFDVVSDDYRTLTGRAPLTIGEIIGRQLDEMPQTAQPTEGAGQA
jgi:NAD(P)H dehydrogenase (quinone)